MLPGEGLPQLPDELLAIALYTLPVPRVTPTRMEAIQEVAAAVDW